MTVQNYIWHTQSRFQLEIMTYIVAFISSKFVLMLMKETGAFMGQLFLPSFWLGVQHSWKWWSVCCLWNYSGWSVCHWLANFNTHSELFFALKNSLYISQDRMSYLWLVSRQKVLKCSSALGEFFGVCFWFLILALNQQESTPGTHPAVWAYVCSLRVSDCFVLMLLKPVEGQSKHWQIK